MLVKVYDLRYTICFFFLKLTCSHMINSFPLEFSSEAISIDKIGSIVP